MSQPNRLRAALLAAVLAIALIAILPGESNAQPQLPDKFFANSILGGLDSPVGMDFLPDGRAMFIELRTGKVRAFVNGALGLIDPLVVVDSVQTLGGERGLTGLAIDSKWPIRPYIYTYYSATNATLRVSRYTVTGDLTSPSSSFLFIDPTSRLDLLRGIPDVHPVHNSGSLRFGPDGMLYLATGDDRNECSAQDTTSFRGVILRLDVSRLPDSPGVADKALLVPSDNPLADHPDVSARLVWSTGLRSPFRFHIDPNDGSIFIGDVGDLNQEEITRVNAAGANLGWPFFEGMQARSYNCPVPPLAFFASPIYAYDRVGFMGDGRASVISAGVYRAPPGCTTCAYPTEYEGNYFFSDFFEGFLRRLVLENGIWRIADPVQGQPSTLDWGYGFRGVADFITGPDGALWFVRMTSNFAVWEGTGEIGRIDYQHPLADVGDALVDGVHFGQPRPTPARGAVWFDYALPVDARVSLEIFDALGRRIAAVQDSNLERAGSHTQSWDGRDDAGGLVAPGIYMARLVVNQEALTRRIALVR